jgi:hypothetical protein
MVLPGRVPQFDPGPAGGSTARRSRGDASFYPNGKAKRVGILWPGGIYGGWMFLNVNPESFTVTLPNRLSVSQGFTGAFVDSLGFGLPSGALSGTCGWGVPLDDPEHGITGLEQIRRMKRAYEDWQDLSAGSVYADGYPCEIIVGPTFDQHYSVVWESQGLNLRHDAGKPFLVYYNLPFRVIRDWNWSSRERAAPLLGTRTGIPDDGSTPPDGNAR